MRVKVIINPASGKPEPVLSVLNEVFDPGGIDWDVAITHKGGDGVLAAREAAEQGYDLIGVYGGDGTVTEVASALVDGGPPILLLPGGTGNALAADLGVPPTLREAAALVDEALSEVRRIDLGRSADCLFVLRMTMGLEAAMVAAATREMKDVYGWLAYAFGGLQALSAAPVAMYSITVDGVTAECEGLAAIVANSASTGVAGVRIADDVSVSDGLLDLVIVQKTNLPGLLGIATAAAQEEPSNLLNRWKGKEIRVDAHPTQVVLADGEEAGSTPVSVTVVPDAVGVLVPKPVAAKEAV
jgi:YegS/Rv2252/BmrU family lipid kinase